MILLDSSIIIAAFREDEKHHYEALKILRSGSDFMLLDHILSETLTVLKIKEGHKVAKNCLHFLLNNQKIAFQQVSQITLTNTIKYFEENQTTLSFVDTILFIFCKEKHMLLSTFDKDLQKQFS